MKKALLTSLVLLFAVQGFSQQIVRTAKIYLSQNPTESLGIYTVEVKIEKNQMGAGITESDRYEESVQDEPCDMTPVYQCISELKINQDVVMTYTLKDEAGNAIGRKTISPELSATRTQDVAQGTQCSPQFPTRAETVLSHVPQFVDFKINQNTVLSVGANFSGYLTADAPAYNFSTDENSFKNLRWFLNNNERSGAAQLIDPANPPVVEEFDYENY